MLNKWWPTCPAPKSLVSQSADLHFSQELHINRETVPFMTNALIAVKLIHCLKEGRTRTEMQSTKEKLSNMASAAKEHVDIYKAKIDEKAEKVTARTAEEKVIAHERARAKEAKAKMELHEAKARHAAQKLSVKQPHQFGHHEPSLVGAQQHGLNQPATGAAPVPETIYPVAGNHPMNKHI